VGGREDTTVLPSHFLSFVVPLLFALAAILLLIHSIHTYIYIYRPVALVSLSLPRVYSLLYPTLLSLPDEEAAALRIQAALSITFVSGLVLATLALLRLGLVAHFIPPAVSERGGGREGGRGVVVSAPCYVDDVLAHSLSKRLPPHVSF